MMDRDLAAARDNWLDEAETAKERAERREPTTSAIATTEGCLPISTACGICSSRILSGAGISPKMAQTLARHGDIRLTLGVYTHIEIHDCTLAIQSLPAPPDGANGKVGTRPSAPGCRHYRIADLWRVAGPLSSSDSAAKRSRSGTHRRRQGA